VNAKSRLALILALCVFAPMLSAQSARLVAVKAGQMFDAKAGRLLPDQTIEEVT
jgi:hypothetical protein